jgi:glucose-induced degradation protein 4
MSSIDIDLLARRAAQRSAIARDRDQRTQELTDRYETARRLPPSMERMLLFGPSDARRLLSGIRSIGGGVWGLQGDPPPREPLPPADRPLPAPAPCAFLRPGQYFEGKQSVYNRASVIQHSWKTSVTIHSYDERRGELTGSMSASLPDNPHPVVTFFTGEVVDNVNHCFYTSQAAWAMTAEMDMAHWKRLPGFSTKLSDEIKKYGGRAPSLAEPGIRLYMRWKERSFVSGGECRLTIAGFYMLSMDRLTGQMDAVYIDPNSTPEQKLTLTALTSKEAGRSFAAHEFA